MNTSQNVNDILDNSLVFDELIKIASELSEIGIDRFFQDGLLKDFPIVGTLFGLTKVGVSIKDKLFLKKIWHFLYQLKDIPYEKRQSFIQKINCEKKFKTKVGETIILLVDKINDYSKADYLGRLFAASIEGKISYSTFLKLANIIDRSYTPDLNNLIPLYHGKSKEVDNTDKDMLYNLGLLINLGVEGQIYVWKWRENTEQKKST